MRILFLQDHLRLGGTEKQTLALAKFGKSLGHETGLIVFRPGGTLKPNSDSTGFFMELQPFNTHVDEWAPGLISKIRQFKPDAIVFMGKVSHLHFARIRKRFPSTTLIATFRSGKPPVPYYARALCNADGIIVNSQVECDRLINTLGIGKDQAKMVHNGCLLNQIPRAANSVDDSFIKILCLAMFRPQKNQQELIRILSKLPKDVKWRCTFAGTGKTLESCKSLVKDLNLEEQVIFTGSTKPEELYAEHDVAALTSDKESLPNFLVEAQCAGLPVVAYLVNGVKECFEESVSGFGIPLGDQQGFADALTVLGQNQSRRQHMSIEARKFGLQHFDFEKRSGDFLGAISTFHEAARRA